MSMSEDRFRAEVLDILDSICNAVEEVTSAVYNVANHCGANNNIDSGVLSGAYNKVQTLRDAIGC